MIGDWSLETLVISDWSSGRLGISNWSLQTMVIGDGGNNGDNGVLGAIEFSDWSLGTV